MAMGFYKMDKKRVLSWITECLVSYLQSSSSSFISRRQSLSLSRCWPYNWYIYHLTKEMVKKDKINKNAITSAGAVNIALIKASLILPRGSSITTYQCNIYSTEKNVILQLI
jgi:hypothetical protein